MKNLTEQRVTFAKHERVLQLHISRYGGWLHLKEGQFPLMASVTLGEIKNIPVIYGLLEGFLTPHGQHYRVHLPHGSSVTRETVRNQENRRREVHLFVFRPTNSSMTNRNGEIRLTGDDLIDLLRNLRCLWAEHKDYLLLFYPYKRDPRLAEPPEWVHDDK